MSLPVRYDSLKDMFRKQQRNSPDEFHPLRIRTLQRGMRNIRAYPLETREEQWQEGVTEDHHPRQFCVMLHQHILTVANKQPAGHIW